MPPVIQQIGKSVLLPHTTTVFTAIFGKVIYMYVYIYQAP